MNTTPETIASIAAHLLQGDDYQGAARKAYKLLKAAEKEIEIQVEQENSANGERERMLDIPEHLDFLAGIRFITGENRKARAEEYFQTLLAKDIPEKGELSKTITRYEKSGFHRWELDALRKMFEKIILTVPQRRKLPAS